MKGEEGKGGERTELNILKRLESSTLDQKGKGTWYVPGNGKGLCHLHWRRKWVGVSHHGL